MEDFITWTDTSAIRKRVLDYNEMVSITEHNGNVILAFAIKCV